MIGRAVTASPKLIRQTLFASITMVERSHLFNFIFPKIKVLGNLDSALTDKKSVLIVSHEGTRTGAPILSYNLMIALQQKYHVVVLFLGPGPLLRACHAAGATVAGPVLAGRSSFFSGFAIRQITKAVQLEFVLVNSIESRSVLKELARQNIPSVSLIHEFATYTRPDTVFPKAVFWSGQVVFSSSITRDNMIDEYPDLGARAYPVIPQGQCILPDDFSIDQREIAEQIQTIKRIMRPQDFDVEGIVVIGAGTVQFRKGVDLFIECASRVLQKNPEIPLRFIWVGNGYDVKGDVMYSVYLADQIRRAGIENHFHFIGEVANLETVYAEADIMLLSSRLDPLPNVAIDALANGLPLVCFDKTTGMVDILNEFKLNDICVAPYLNTEGMASKVCALINSRELREQIAKRGKDIAAKVFEMTKYVDEIERLALKEAERLWQLELDISTIKKSDILRLDYYVSPHWWQLNRDEIIRKYVRSWSSGVGKRKLFPGFHPGIYIERHGVQTMGRDPLADYLLNGQPKGPWNYEVVTSDDEAVPLPPQFRIGLHVHVFYPELFPEILDRLIRNRIRPDLLISVPSEAVHQVVDQQLEAYAGDVADIRVMPNRGRDIGPFLTGFRDKIFDYDIIGHLHTKKTADIKVKSTGMIWYQFLLENLLGGESHMADIILGRMAQDHCITMVFPDDPHVVGWGGNYNLGKKLLPEFVKGDNNQALCFPVGTMFWARPDALKRLLDLDLNWEDYPEEPLPYDGTMLHAIERLFGIVAASNNGSILLTNVPGVSR